MKWNRRPCNIWLHEGYADTMFKKENQVRANEQTNERTDTVIAMLPHFASRLILEDYKYLQLQVVCVFYKPKCMVYICTSPYVLTSIKTILKMTYFQEYYLKICHITSSEHLYRRIAVGVCILCGELCCRSLYYVIFMSQMAIACLLVTVEPFRTWAKNQIDTILEMQ